jgi:Chromo (CHRromatin Organisation MOdifier) domain
MTSTTDPPPAIGPEDNWWEVEELRGRRKVGKGLMYLVKWMGCPESENTWEKKKDISAKLVMAYDAIHFMD